MHKINVFIFPRKCNCGTAFYMYVHESAINRYMTNVLLLAQLFQSRSAYTIIFHKGYNFTAVPNDATGQCTSPLLRPASMNSRSYSVRVTVKSPCGQCTNSSEEGTTDSRSPSRRLMSSYPVGDLPPFPTLQESRTD